MQNLKYFFMRENSGGRIDPFLTKTHSRYERCPISQLNRELNDLITLKAQRTKNNT